MIRSAMLKPAPDIQCLRAQFRWDIPARYNMGTDVCDRWAAAEPHRVAIIDLNDGYREVTFGQLKEQSDRLADVLAARGIRPDAGAYADRVGVLLPQQTETAVAHIAAWKSGLISIPLFTQFGPDALAHRLKDSGAKAVITNAEGVAKIAAIRNRLPALELVLSVDGAGEGAEDYHAALVAASPDFTPADTVANDPAIIIYTSGTTGPPKGALHAHRVLPGHLPGVEMSHNFLPQPEDRLWTPADWAWIGGLLDVLMPGLHHGLPVIAKRFAKFDAAAAFALMRDHNVRNAFLPPTALKLMRQVPDPQRFGLQLRSVASGGEPLGAELLAWGRQAFGTTINEFYGQTECNMVVSACAEIAAPVPGHMGFAVPGHEVAVIDPQSGAPVPDGAEGAIAVRTGSPVQFLSYWNNPDATAEKFTQDREGSRWLLTGDQGLQTTDGLLRFTGRDDDVISSAGYRIGPAEIEDCLLKHPAVALAGVIGAPDPVRGQKVVAFIVPADSVRADEELAADIQAFVKRQLAAYEYPRDVRFIPSLPLTTTGKIIRRALRELYAEESATV